MPLLTATEPTYLASLFGGALIGAAAVLLMAFHGRIAGITGILGALLPPAPAKDWTWRVAFLAGMVASPMLFWLVTGSPIAISVPVSNPALIIGGIIVGIGVVFGSGCTSGHGVCGLARLSPRSIAAVAAFMTTAGITVYLIRHMAGA
ncbi:MAG TPA: YeeE/YedE thiosulfate transporter family protein [Hyphomicrobiaceae bacterium]|nr:YeeE/YedE thiosulfate transporter family protein [Hyphomicrobiaceae bacterium]